MKTDHNHPGWLLLGGEIPMILRKSDGLICLSRSYGYAYDQQNEECSLPQSLIL